MEQLIKPTTLGGFVRSLSGIFITKENPQGLTRKECTVIAILLNVMEGNKELTKEAKIEVSNQLNQSVQVTTNYLNKFRAKGVMVGNKMHPIFYMDKITIEYAR